MPSGLVVFTGDGLWHLPKMLMELLLTGPRMIANVAWERRRARRLAGIAQADCVAAIEALRAENRRIDISELLRRVKAVDAAKMLQDLTEFDGVLFLEGPPPGLALSSELFEEIAETAREARATPNA